MINTFFQERKPFLIVDNTKSKNEEKREVKKVNSVKPKGDIELKNIYYRYIDKRYVGIKNINKQVIRVYAKTQKECYEKLRAEISKAKNTIVVKNKTSRSFQEHWNKWYEENKKPFVSIQTQKEIERIKNKLKYFYNFQINKINKDEIVKYLKTINEGRAKEKIIIYLKAFFKNIFENGYIKANPFANIVTKPRILKRKPAFTYEQQTEILQRIEKEEIKPIILIYLITGLRRREFDFKNIDKNLSEEEYLLKAINLKGRNQETRYKTIKLSKSGYLLIKNNIELIKRHTEENVYRKFAKILKELNIKGSIVNLRHTYATNNFYLGNPELFISRQMGHSSTQITKNNYTDIDYHLSKDKVIKLYNNLYPIFD